LAEDDYQKEDPGLSSKRHKLEVPSTSIAESTFSIQTSCGRDSTVDILMDGVHEMAISYEELDIEHPKTNCKSKFPVSSHCLIEPVLSSLRGLPRIQDAPSLQISSTFHDIRSAGAGLQPPDNQKDEEICFGMVRYQSPVRIRFSG